MSSEIVRPVIATTDGYSPGWSVIHDARPYPFAVCPNQYADAICAALNSNADGWIDVKERLPTQYECCYLIVLMDESGRPRVGQAFIRYPEDFKALKYSHWRELPAPPSAGDV